MENICSEYPVIYNESIIGRAKIEKIGIRFFVSADIKKVDAETPFRLAAVCSRRLVPFGVMLPKEGGYTYGKMFTGGALRELEIDEVKGFTIICDIPENNVRSEKSISSVAAGWIREDKPGELLEEGEFRRLFSACEEALVRREDDITYIAVPVIKDEEFPVMPVFCLGEAWKINGGVYLVFRVHNGKLSF